MLRVSDGLGRHILGQLHRPPHAKQLITVRYQDEILRPTVRPYAVAVGSSSV